MTKHKEETKVIYYLEQKLGKEWIPFGLKWESVEEAKKDLQSLGLDVEVRFIKRTTTVKDEVL